MVAAAPAVKYFQDEIDKIDPGKSLVVVLDQPGYGASEWSYEGLTVRAGGSVAAEQGLSALLHAMGFKWYAPFDETDSLIPPRRPAAIDDTLTKPKSKFALPHLSFGPSYGAAGWRNGPLLDDRQQVLAGYDRWAILNCVHNSRNPYIAGHRWQAVVMADAEYWAAREHFLLPGDTPQSRRFDLLGMDDSERAECVVACAANLLFEGLGEYRRTHFDPTDGNPHDSTTVCDFTRDVCEQVRVGTGAIGKYPPQAGVPDAVLNILAYSNHGAPPAEGRNYSDHIHVQVTTAYRSGALSIAELVDTWRPIVQGVSLYDYWDLPVWFDCMPISDRSTKVSYSSDVYPGYVGMGVTAVAAEVSCNWMQCLLKYHHHSTFARTGRYSFDEALESVVSDVFEGDPAVRSLFKLWSDNSTFFHQWSLAASFRHVTAMRQGTWYRTAFEQLHVVYDEYRRLLNLPKERPDLAWIRSGSGIRTPMQDTAALGYSSTDDPFPVQFKTLMGHNHALRLAQVHHVWAMQSRMANGGTMATNYPKLYLSRDRVEPGINPVWMDPLFDVPPSNANFEEAKSTLWAETARADSEQLDDEDLVLVTGLTPRFAAAPAPDVRLQHEPLNTWAKLKFVALDNDASVTISRSDGSQPQNLRFRTGIHDLDAGKDTRVTPRGGHLFLAGFPPVATEVDGSQYYWLYIPANYAGKTRVSTNGAFAVRDETGILQALGAESGDGPWDWGSGQVAVVRQQTRGQHVLLSGLNKWLSLDSTMALMPRAMANAEAFSDGVSIVDPAGNAVQKKHLGLLRRLCQEKWCRRSKLFAWLCRQLGCTPEAQGDGR